MLKVEPFLGKAPMQSLSANAFEFAIKAPKKLSTPEPTELCWLWGHFGRRGAWPSYNSMNKAIAFMIQHCSGRRLEIEIDRNWEVDDLSSVPEESNEPTYTR